MAVDNSLFLKRRIRKAIASSSTLGRSTTITWGTDCPSGAWGIVVVDMKTQWTTAGGPNPYTLDITIDGGATIWGYYSNAAFIQEGVSPYGILIKKSEGSVANPVVTFTFTKTGGTSAHFVQAFWVFEGEA